MNFDMNLFSADLRAKRGNVSIRETARRMGFINLSMLSRIENGAIPNIHTFLKLCDWMGVPPNCYIRIDGGRKSPDTVAFIEACLRDDESIGDDVVDAVVGVVKIILGSVK